MDPSDDAGPSIGLTWPIRENEARLLADSLRTSRLTLLYASTGASRRALLCDGVVPLMGRRETDVRAETFLESRVIEPFVDHRGDRGGGGLAERVVYFSDWHGGDPRDALTRTVWAAFEGDEADAVGRQALADVLQTLCERHATRLFVVLDAVERLWALDADAAISARFVEDFAEAVNRPLAQTNFLLAVDDRFEGRLDALRRSIPRFDDSTVRLLGFAEAEKSSIAATMPARRSTTVEPATTRPRGSPGPPTLVDAIGAFKAPSAPGPVTSKHARQKQPKVSKAPPAPIETDGVYAFIASRLGETADVSEPWHDDADDPSSPGQRGRAHAAQDFEPTRPMRDRDGAPDAVATDFDVKRASSASHTRRSSLSRRTSTRWLEAAGRWWRRLSRRD